MCMWLFIWTFVLVYLCSQASSNGESRYGEKERPYREYIASSGTTFTFKCDRTHERYDNVTWWKNDSNKFVAQRGGSTFQRFNQKYSGRLNFERHKNLIISNCQGSDHGFYYCETRYKNETKQGGYYNLVVEEKPKCERTVSAITALNGTESAFLPCNVRGRPTPSYEWRKVVGKKLVKLGSRFIASAQGLSIARVRTQDAGTYQVKLSSSVKDFHASVQLYIITAKSINRGNYKSVLRGDNVYLDCGQSVPKKGTAMTWLNSVGTDMSVLKRFNILHNGSLSINYVQLSDNGIYTCERRTNTGQGVMTMSVLMYLNVQYTPAITFIKRRLKVYKNSRVIMPCYAKGNPRPKPQWILQNGTVIRSSNKHEILTNGSMIIHNVQIADVMNYTCAPVNSIGSATPSVTSLSIIVPPHFESEHIERIRARVHDNVLINCTASGLPIPITSWRYLNGSIDRNRMIMTPSGLLSIEKVKRKDNGVFICIAQSVAGKSTRRIQLIILSKPHTPKDFSVITERGYMHFSWRPAYGGGAKQYFELWYRPTYTTNYQWSSIASITSTYKIHRNETNTGTFGGASFYCSVRSGNSEGYSEFTSVVKTSKLLPNGNKLLSKTLESPLSRYPLSPYGFKLVISKEGYKLKWKYILTPGVPASSEFLIEYRVNSTYSWKTFVRKKIVRRSLAAAKGKENLVSIKKEELPGVRHPLEFQVSSVTATGVRSKPSVPMIKDDREPTIVTQEQQKQPFDTNLIPPIVMGIIFGVFAIILVISLYCYFERKKKRTASKESKANLVLNDNNNVTIDRMSIELRDSAKLLPPETIGSKDQLKKSDKKKSLYKSSSLPSVLFTSDADVSAVDPLDMRDEGDDFEVVDLNKPAEQLQRGLFRDSYDKFCRSDSNDAPLHKTSSPLTDAENKTELKKLPSSEDSPSQIPSASKTNTETASSKRSNKESPETKSLKSIDRKSSGFGDGDSSASDPDSVDLGTFEDSKIISKGTLLMSSPKNNTGITPYSKTDTGYFSDVPTRISSSSTIHPKLHNHQNRKYSGGKKSGYFSEDETVSRVPYRPLKPPSYTDAIIDIERMSVNNDITDSESVCKQLLEMERKLGVKLDDSIENNLDKERPLTAPPDRFRASSYRDTGYMSDVSGSTKVRYTDREKSARCTQLLKEFKSNRQPGHQGNLTEETVIEEDPADVPRLKAPPARCVSVIENTISDEHPSTPNRCSSTNTNIYNEWLV